MMRHFLTIFPSFPINRKSVKAGNNPPSVVTACRCVNVGLFLSHDLRRDVIVSIAHGESDDLSVISFPGETLKRVSPDERSISFFLLKANKLVREIPFSGKANMDNGIIVTRNSLKQFIEDWSPQNVYLAAKKPFKATEYHNLVRNSLFVYVYAEDFDHQGIDFDRLPRPSSPERQILDVNHYFDSLQ